MRKCDIGCVALVLLGRCAAVAAAHARSIRSQRCGPKTADRVSAGWTYRRSGKLDTWTEGAATVYGVPYSEHSNFAELRDCVASLRPKRLIPTVNVTDQARCCRSSARSVYANIWIPHQPTSLP